jgi:hypothetical protein
MTPIRNLGGERKLPDSKLERFLLAVANAHVSESGAARTKAGDDTGRIFRFYSEFLPHVPSTTEEAFKNLTLLLVLKMRRKQPGSDLLLKDEAAYRRGIVAEFRDRLLDIWAAQEPETAEWRLWCLWELAQALMAGAASAGKAAPDALPPRPVVGIRTPLPVDAPLCQALAYLWRKLGKLKKCPSPECPNRLFIAEKASQESCSPVCARREAMKARWKLKRRKAGGGKPTEEEPAAEGGGTEAIEAKGGPPRMPEADLKAFILDVVNADGSKVKGGGTYLFDTYPAFFPTRERDIKARLALNERNPARREALKSEYPVLYHELLFRDLRDGLRNLWGSDESTAAWMFFRVQSAMHGRIDIRRERGRTLRPPPPHIPVQQALAWVRSRLPKLEICRNGGCSRPFFVARGNERYCTDECRRAALNAIKLASYKDHWKNGKWVRNPAKGRGRPKAPAPDPERR